MIIPFKAEPDKPGRAFLFGADRASDKHILGIAKNITLTDLPIKEGGYSSSPSVLIIDTNGFSVRYNMTSHFDAKTVVYGPYERTKKNSPIKRQPRNPQTYIETETDRRNRSNLVSEEEFLNKVRFSEEFGVNIHYNDHFSNDKHNIKLAKKYFDITLIMSSERVFEELIDFPEVDKKVRITSSRSSVEKYSSERFLIPVLRIGDPRRLGDPVKGSSELFLLRSTDNREQRLINFLEQKLVKKLLVQDDLLIQDKSPVKYPTPKMNEKYYNKTNIGRFAIKVPVLIAIVTPIAISGLLLLLGWTSPMIMLSLGGGAGLLLGIITRYKVGNRTDREVIGSYLKRVEQSLEERTDSGLYQINESAKRVTNRVGSTGGGGSISNQTVSHSPDNIFNESELLHKIRTLQDKWVKYELNPLLSLKFPLMMDMACEETLDFHQANNALLSAQGSYEKGNTTLNELYTIFLEAEKTFLRAESNAQKSKHSTLTKEQRKKVGTAHNLVSIALDDESSPNERINAWKKANDQLEGIIHLPDRVVKGLLEERAAV